MKIVLVSAGNQIFVILLSFAYLGCGETSASTSEDYFNGEPSGKFVVQTQNTGFDSSFYSKGCKVLGKKEPVYQVDSALKSGMNFTNFSAMRSPTKFYYLITQENIQAVAQQFISTKLKVLDAQGMGGIKKGMVLTQNCRYSGSDEDCKLDPKTQTVDLSQECKVTDIIQIEKEEYMTGSFKFKNTSEDVLAQKEMTKYKVNLRCPFYKGEGWIETMSIKSNDIPAATSFFCGGVSVYNFFSIKKSDGGILNAAVSEVFEAPVRK